MQMNHVTPTPAASAAITGADAVPTTRADEVQTAMAELSMAMADLNSAANRRPLELIRSAMTRMRGLISEEPT